MFLLYIHFLPIYFYVHVAWFGFGLLFYSSYYSVCIKLDFSLFIDLITDILKSCHTFLGA